MLRKTRTHNGTGSTQEKASMRPQHDAAENDEDSAVSGRVCDASMRPQHDAAENGAAGTAWPVAWQASMRPQHDAAENQKRSARLLRRRPRFNEAAA